MLRVGVASEKYIDLPEAYNLAGDDKNKWVLFHFHLTDICGSPQG